MEMVVLQDFVLLGLHGPGFSLWSVFELVQSRGKLNIVSWHSFIQTSIAAI